MITIDFVKLAMDTLIKKPLCLAKGGIVESSYGTISDLTWATGQTTTDVVAKTSGNAVYFNEASDNAAHTVDEIVTCVSTTNRTPLYKLPLQNSVTIYPGYQIKINPYQEDDSGNHTRGIMIKFSIAEEAAE